MKYQGSELSNNKALLSSLGIQEGSTVSLCDAAQVLKFFTSFFGDLYHALANVTNMTSV